MRDSGATGAGAAAASERAPRIALIGSDGDVGAEVEALAEAVGAALARAGAQLLSGGRNGVMVAACRGAKAAGGLTVGILPGDDPAEANPYVDVAVTTGLSMEARSLVLIHSADAVIMIAGGNGTLGELSAAYLNRRPVVVMTGSGGWADRIRAVLEGDPALAGRYLDARRNVAVHFADTPEGAVALAVELARTYVLTAGSRGDAPDVRPAAGG